MMQQAPITHSQQPIVTGTSVLGITYAGGVMLMADTLGSYGSLARFKNLERVHKVNNSTILGCGGEYSDFQEIKNYLRDIVNEDFVHDDGINLTPQEIHSYLGRVMYNRRSKFDPLWNELLCAGFDGKKGYLGYVDLQGTSFQENILATGYGAYIAIPILRNRHKEDLTEEEAKTLLEDAMRVMFYRDCRTINNFQIAKVDASGATVSEPYSLTTKWNYTRFVDPNMA